MQNVTSFAVGVLIEVTRAGSLASVLDLVSDELNR